MEQSRLASSSRERRYILRVYRKCGGMRQEGRRKGGKTQEGTVHGYTRRVSREYGVENTVVPRENSGYGGEHNGSEGVRRARGGAFLRLHPYILPPFTFSSSVRVSADARLM